MSLDAITSRIRQDAGADFAFILTRKGRLLTREAPAQMPEVGRATCVAAANEALEAGVSLVERTMPREHLVPFGGAAPVDVFVSPCGEAIVCVVLATWADASAVGPALEEHLPNLAELLADAKAKRTDRARTGRTVAPPAPPPPPDAIRPPRATPRPAAATRAAAAGTRGLAAAAGGASPAPPPSRPSARPSRPARERASSRPARPGRPPTPPAPSSRPPARRDPPSSSARGRSAPTSTRSRPLSGLVEMSRSGVRASDQMQRAPTIAVRPAPSVASRTGSPPAVRLPLSSEVPRGGAGSLPGIDLATAPLGRETLAAIQADGHARGSLPHIEVRDAMLGRDTLAAIDADHDATHALTRAPSIEVAAIEVGEEELGQASLLALEDEARDGTPAGSPLTSAPDLDVRVSDVGSVPPPAAMDRSTQPWTESPEDAVRATKAAELARRLAPPDVEAAPLDPAELRRRRQNSGVDLFHEALGELLGDDHPKRR